MVSIDGKRHVLKPLHVLGNTLRYDTATGQAAGSPPVDLLTCMQALELICEHEGYAGLAAAASQK